MPETPKSDDANEEGAQATEADDTGPTKPSDGDESKAAAWGRPLARLDSAWTNFETRLCVVVLVLEILSLSLWVALKGMSARPDSGSNIGIVFRGLVGMIGLGSLAFLLTRKASKTVQRIATIGSMLFGVFAAKLWTSFGVEYSSNLLNWYQQASTLTLLGGLRGIGTRFTVLLTLLGGSLATAAGKHITIDLVTRLVKPKVRIPMLIVGWVGTSAICFVAAWGFFDHVAIQAFKAQPDSTPSAKISSVKHGLGESWFIFSRQMSLDLKSTPHVVFKGDSYSDWLKGDEWNAWIDDQGFKERFGEEKTKALKVPPTSTRAPIIVIPERGEPRGELVHVANLVFPFGLFIMALRFLLLCALVISGHKDVSIDESGGAFGEDFDEAHADELKAVMGDEIEKYLIGSVNEKCTGICRPRALSFALPNMLCIISTAGTPWYSAIPKSR